MGSIVWRLPTGDDNDPVKSRAKRDQTDLKVLISHRAPSAVNDVGPRAGRIVVADDHDDAVARHVVRPLMVVQPPPMIFVEIDLFIHTN